VVNKTSQSSCYNEEEAARVKRAVFRLGNPRVFNQCPIPFAPISFQEGLPQGQGVCFPLA